MAGQVIASHYAQPIERELAAEAILRAEPSDKADEVIELGKGEPFSLLDDTLGWAWGYGGKERRVGYVRSEAMAKG